MCCVDLSRITKPATLKQQERSDLTAVLDQVWRSLVTTRHGVIHSNRTKLGRIKVDRTKISRTKLGRFSFGTPTHPSLAFRKRADLMQSLLNTVPLSRHTVANGAMPQAMTTLLSEGSKSSITNTLGRSPSPHLPWIALMLLWAPQVPQKMCHFINNSSRRHRHLRLSIEAMPTEGPSESRRFSCQLGMPLELILR